MERLHRAGTLAEIRSYPFAEESEEYFAKVVDSPVGAITLVANEEALISLAWGALPVRPRDLRANALVDATAKQLAEYFAKKRTSFDIPLLPRGTEFQKRVWQELLNIPYGESISYGTQARRLARPGAARAVGAANGKNPIGILIPCHRVLGASGALTGFAGGVDVKRALLAIEGIEVAR